MRTYLDIFSFIQRQGTKILVGRINDAEIPFSNKRQKLGHFFCNNQQLIIIGAWSRMYMSVNF